jgi:hypothetical protein
MGCTLDAVLVRGQGLYLAHVGDSRVYGLLGGTLYQLTEDHTYGQALLSSGAMPPEEVRVHPSRNHLVRALGIYPNVEVDTIYLDLAPGDTFLLCSDGLHGVVQAAAIAQALSKSPEQAVQQLIAEALDHGAPDNVTAVVLKVGYTSVIQPIRIGSQETLCAMARASLFADFSESELLRVQRIASGRVVEQGQQVVGEEELGTELFLVLDGSLSAWMEGTQVGVLGPGDPFGELTLHPVPAVATIRAESRARILVFPLSDIQHLQRSDSAVAAKLAMNCLKRVWQRLHQLARATNHLRTPGA